MFAWFPPLTGLRRFSCETMPWPGSADQLRVHRASDGARAVSRYPSSNSDNLHGIATEFPGQSLSRNWEHPLAEMSGHTKLILRNCCREPKSSSLRPHAGSRHKRPEWRTCNARDVTQSKKLLAIMQETMALQISHVNMLEREVRADPAFKEPMLRLETIRKSASGFEPNGRLGSD